jgi:hypothetical protein
MLALQPGVQFLLGLFPLHAIPLLQPPDELVFFTVDDLNVVVGQLAELLLNRSFLVDSICLAIRPSS